MAGQNRKTSIPEILLADDIAGMMRDLQAVGCVEKLIILGTSKGQSLRICTNLTSDFEIKGILYTACDIVNQKYFNQIELT